MLVVHLAHLLENSDSSLVHRADRVHLVLYRGIWYHRHGRSRESLSMCEYYRQQRTRIRLLRLGLQIDWKSRRRRLVDLKFELARIRLYSASMSSTPR